jgi:RNA polymerase sigma factor (sigma-70 family)
LFVGVVVLQESTPVVLDPLMTFEQFYADELDGQVRRCFVLTGSNEMANDIVHDAMTEVYRRWSSLDNPGAYLNRAVLNRCRDLGRRRHVADRSLRMVTAAELARPHGATDSVDMGRALARLPFNQRAAVALRYYGGFTTAEIAEALDCRPGSVGPWINRGLSALRKELS